jgi:uncharacterized protein YciI
MIYALFYDYVENIVERRAPHRPAHLALLEEWRADGRLVMGGALGEPPHGALIVLDVDDESVVQRFVDADPYVQAGLVTGWRAEPWHVV